MNMKSKIKEKNGNASDDGSTPNTKNNDTNINMK